MTGRHIEDQTDLIHSMITKCELSEENGAIVFLDQEKAYDKIRHDYLWAVLDHLKFPPRFINSIKAMYSSANTQILINGVLGDPFRITRGVRQGDPLSCLLFNLAIEPLACMLRASSLEGFRIPSLADKLIATLFADDTTAYLSCRDNPAILDNILEKWCLASGAKFNTTKSIYLPVGQPEFRKTVWETRRLNSTTAPIPAHIHIIKDGEHTRALGAYVGNNTNQIAIWDPIVETIDKNLTRWARGNPTQEGRRLIANMEVGGRTQYLTRVQGMPTDVLDRINKLLSAFVWNEDRPSINADTLRAPIRLGGRKLIDLHARNEAIELRKYQCYCTSNPELRPQCAYVVDEILSHHINVYNNTKDSQSIICPPLQAFELHLRSRVAPLPEFITRMFTVKTKYNAIFDPPSLPEHLKHELPLWYHIGHDTDNPDVAQPSRYVNWNNLKHAQCIRITHNVVTVGDAVTLHQRTLSAAHSARRNCKCQPCKEDREKGCENPHECATKCAKLLNKLSPKFLPALQAEIGNDIPVAQDMILEQADKKYFNKLAHISNLDDGFRVFGQHSTTSQTPLTIGSLPPGTNRVNVPTTIVYTDGSCEHNGTLHARAGAGIWYAPDDLRNKSIRLPEEIEQTNNTGELVAILTAAQDAPSNDTLEICTDSQYAIDNLTKLRPTREREGWINMSNQNIFKKIISVLRQRNGSTFLIKVKGHSGNAGNDGADEMARLGAQKHETDAVDLSTPRELQLEGAQLAGLTQAQLYKGIREKREHHLTPRRTTTSWLDITRWAANDRWGTLPTDSTIWHSIRDHNIDRKIRAFMYKSIHGTHRIGTYWDHVPQHEHRARCTTCAGTEDLEHILTICPNYGQETIWRLALDLLRLKGLDIDGLTIGDILSAPLASFKLQNGKPDTALNRLYTIIITESMYLIWLLRCEWRIDRNEDPEKLHSQQEITSRWHFRINRRLRIDQTMARKRTHKWKKITKNLVLRTWQGILNNEENLPPEWIGTRGVLVRYIGVEGRPPGRNR
ncbi:hypothetical protein D9619_000262 [Psilocybe cf. subviscida]|uniref:RNase H type-1 domain-containing protein n=1 Tax=Psilocybe cf. subviscida TaxID=2480587 RepID=A0A8H5BE88_9AGAR|nr:hypothetical protein D9619_000262 [Psilocybe cf. subviscida]